MRVFPKQKFDILMDNEPYYRVQCILNIPFRGTYKQILEDNNCITWEMLHGKFNLQISEAVSNYFSDDECEDLEEIDDNVRRNAAEMLSSFPQKKQNLEMGERLTDVIYNYNEEIKNPCTISEVEAFLETYKNIDPKFSTTNTNFSLSQEQRSAIDTVNEQLQYINHKIKTIPPKRIIIQGKAGCGKSTLLTVMITRITEQLGADSVMICAPTGVAALNVNGQTIHTAFNLSPFKKEIIPLSSKSLNAMQIKHNGIQFYFFDEWSMIGSNRLLDIQYRLQELYPNIHEPFAGKFIYFLGDFQQLPPVNDTALYDFRTKSPRGILGIELFKTFQKFIELKIAFRQSTDENFALILDRLAVGKITTQDYNELSKRSIATISPAEISKFKNAVHLCANKETVRKQNLHYLNNKNNPVAKITSQNHPNIVTSQSEDRAQGLQAHLMLSIGCKVMLRRNLWVSGGLVNGTTGTVKAIIYDEGITPPELPLYILVDFDNYAGPCIKDNLFPVVPVTATWTYQNIKYTRKQFPLTLAHAITIHKCQGLTIHRAVLDIGDKEFASGLAYVALSRVKSLNDLTFQPMPKFSRLNAISSRSDFASKCDFTEWFETIR